MRRLLRLTKHLLMTAMLGLAAAVLVAGALSLWRPMGAALLLQHGSQTLTTHHALAQARDGRLRLGYAMARTDPAAASLSATTDPDAEPWLRTAAGWGPDDPGRGVALGPAGAWFAFEFTTPPPDPAAPTPPTTSAVAHTDPPDVRAVVVLPAALVGLVLLVLPIFWVRGIVLGFRKVRVRSAQCLHCGQRFREPVGEVCPNCGRPVPMVTVSQRAAD